MPYKTASVLFGLRTAVNKGLESIEQGNDFAAVDADQVWEMIIVRDKNNAYLSIKSWDPDLLKKLQKNFNHPDYTASLNLNGHHLIITRTNKK